MAQRKWHWTLAKLKRRVLAQACDESIPLPERDLDKPFLMPVEDVFSIPGRGLSSPFPLPAPCGAVRQVGACAGTVVTGAVEQGCVNTGDELEIVGGDQRDKTTSTVCTGDQCPPLRRARGCCLERSFSFQVSKCSRSCWTVGRLATT